MELFSLCQINRRHVVTAGHCVKNKARSSIHVTLGEYHLKMKEPYPSQNFRVTRAVVHPRFKFSPAADRHASEEMSFKKSRLKATYISDTTLPF